jgi:hypothetical protein
MMHDGGIDDDMSRRELMRKLASIVEPHNLGKSDHFRLVLCSFVVSVTTFTLI